jgi:peptide deformylase
MTIRPIIEAPDALLKQISAPVTVFDDALKTLIADMFETMYAAPGIGLAAVQVGVALRVVVLDLQDAGDDAGDLPEGAEPPEPVLNPRIFINPVLVNPSSEMSVYNEGCLSVPEYYAEVERPAAVTLRWQDADGAAHEEAMSGMLATCIQHEMDHLEGILFIDHLSRLKRNMVLKKLEKARK